ncbi:protachykinin-1 isoform X2 [Syngnathoides biaculeatus]|uniref:protachykinin-1 isoform X2 n=1 Tax=Syngnathoides biaculeatus TaxID=300417 RepID=UPI002ADD8581|nr:protachykinin-1 isoform X2 [Syngnathoides biaculeatus]
MNLRVFPLFMLFVAVTPFFCKENFQQEIDEYWTNNHIQEDGWMSSDPFREMLLRRTRKPRPHQFISLMGKRSMAKTQIPRKNVPGRTCLISHDIDVGDAPPVKQHPYRMNLVKSEILQKEVQYMLDNDIIEPSDSPWSSTSVLVPKRGGGWCSCTNMKTVNALSRADSYPLPRADDCIDHVSQATYVSKFDLLKGFWQVPLVVSVKTIAAFATPDELYQYKMMVFSLKNAPATFQWLVNNVTSGLEGVKAYMDDVIVYAMERGFSSSSRDCRQGNRLSILQSASLKRPRLNSWGILYGNQLVG